MYLEQSQGLADFQKKNAIHDKIIHGENKAEYLSSHAQLYMVVAPRRPELWGSFKTG